MIPSRTACSITRTSTARLFLTVDRLHSSEIHPWTARSTAPLVIMVIAKCPRVGTTRLRQPARYGSLVLPSNPRNASFMLISPVIQECRGGDVGVYAAASGLPRGFSLCFGRFVCREGLV